MCSSSLFPLGLVLVLHVSHVCPLPPQVFRFIVCNGGAAHRPPLIWSLLCFISFSLRTAQLDPADLGTCCEHHLLLRASDFLSTRQSRSGQECCRVGNLRSADSPALRSPHFTDGETEARSLPTTCRGPAGQLTNPWGVGGRGEPSPLPLWGSLRGPFPAHDLYMCKIKGFVPQSKPLTLKCSCRNSSRCSCLCSDG